MGLNIQGKCDGTVYLAVFLDFLPVERFQSSLHGFQCQRLQGLRHACLVDHTTDSSSHSRLQKGLGLLVLVSFLPLPFLVVERRL